jgi:CRP/FNR family transcriptional regulator
MSFPITSAITSGRLSAELRRFFLQQGASKDYPSQAGLLRQDEPVGQIYLIESGLVKLTRTDALGREVVVGLRFSNTMLGAASAISGNPAAASAATLAASRICCLPANVFLQQMETNSILAKQVARAIGQNYYELALHQARLCTLSALGRVASLLLQFIPEEAQSRSMEIRLQLPINQADAAGLLAISKEHYNRMLRNLKKAGIIRQSKGWIYISNLERLRREAGDDQFDTHGQK